MKKGIALFAVFPFLVAGCIDVVTSGPSVVTLETDDVTSSSVKVDVVLKGDMPSNCRLTKAFLVEDVDASAMSEELIWNMAQVEGHAIELPCTEVLSGLSPFKDYNVMVAYESSNGKHACYATFKTLPEAGRISLFLVKAAGNWTSGDAAGLWSLDREGTPNVNTSLAVSDFYLDLQKSLFQPSKEIQMPSVGNDRLFIYYPYSTATLLSSFDYTIHSQLAQDQVCDPSEVLSPGSFMCGVKEVTPSTAQIDLDLANVLGTVEFVVNTSNYPGFEVTNISMFDYNEEALLSGEFSYDPDKETVKAVKTAAFSSVTVNKAPDAEAGALKATILPGDYSSADIRVFVSLSSADASMTVPMKYPGNLIVGKGEKTVCNIESLVPDIVAYPWYEPLETRDMLGSVVYGGQNTWCIECKPTGQSSITFDVKVRGNILGAKTPKYYGIMLPSNIKNGKFLVLPDGTDVYEAQPARAIPADYKITVGCYGQDQCSGNWGVVAIYDEDYNVLWSYMIWRYDTGDPIGEVTYATPGFTLMDRALGACKGQSRAVADGSMGIGIAYFEWGRKDPYPWYNQVPDHYTKESPASGRGIDYVVAHPNIWQTYSSNKTWLFTETPKNYWGNENSTTANNTNITGHKTIYDPCPEGWRVCDYAVCDYVHKNKILAERVATSSETRYKTQNKNKALHLALPSPYSDYSVVAIDLGGGNYDYWPYYGLMWGSSNAWANKSGNDTDYAYAYWSNSNASKSNYKASVVIGYYTSSSWTTTTSMVMADAYTVRCQKEN